MFTNHPIGLFRLFFIEMWERLAFYTMVGILLLYATDSETGGLGWSSDVGNEIYGLYLAFVYFTPYVGGLLADRFLGYRKSVLIGGLLFATGFFLLATGQKWAFPTGLVFLCCGNGFFKPNISSLVGKLYAEGDPRRDGAFTIFYMGINIGAFLAPLACGYLGETYGWHYGFGAAGIGMTFGLLLFLASQHMLGDHGHPPHKVMDPSAPRFSKSMGVVWIGGFLAIPFFMMLVQANYVMGPLLLGLLFVVMGALLYIALKQEPDDRDRMFVVMVLLFFSTTFWAFFEQAGSSINLFTERNVDRQFLGFLFPTSWGQAINPGFIIMLAPLFSMLWTELGKRDKDPTPGVKFGFSLILLGLGFVVLQLSANFADGSGMVPISFLFLGYFLHTVGELCMSPVGLSMVTKLSPAKSVGFVMGAWLVSSSYAHYIAGFIAKLTGGGGHGGDEAALTGVEGLELYTSVFGSIGYVAIGVGVFCLAISPILKKWMHGVK